MKAVHLDEVVVYKLDKHFTEKQFRDEFGDEDSTYKLQKYLPGRVSHDLYWYVQGNSEGDHELHVQ